MSQPADKDQHKDKKEKKADKSKKPREKKPERYEGSRWAPVILLILTIIASVCVSLIN